MNVERSEEDLEERECGKIGEFGLRRRYGLELLKVEPILLLYGPLEPEHPKEVSSLLTIKTLDDLIRSVLQCTQPIQVDLVIANHQYIVTLEPLPYLHTRSDDPIIVAVHHIVVANHEVVLSDHCVAIANHDSSRAKCGLDLTKNHNYVVQYCVKLVSVEA